MHFAGEKITSEMLMALLPEGVQGPAQGPNSPIKDYGGIFMPDASQPTGYRPTPTGLPRL